jgi:hypothetical protein
VTERRGPRLKPTIETAGDISYAGKRRERLRELLQQTLDNQRRVAELEAWREERRQLEWAAQWIEEHGGSVPAALKRTHPDHGGNTRDFMNTQRARQILESQPT